MGRSIPTATNSSLGLTWQATAPSRILRLLATFLSPRESWVSILTWLMKQQESYTSVWNMTPFMSPFLFNNQIVNWLCCVFIIIMGLSFVIDEENDRIAIPCDNIKETLAALRVISKGHLDEQESPIRIFIQLVSTTSAPASTGNCLGNAHHDLLCSVCKAEITGFVYKCLQCDNDFTLCGRCDTAGKHSEHVVVRFVGDQVFKFCTYLFFSH